MSETNKILDVTYGTFSCRLEGFDDSVQTMKTVVTFFHEMAGHDRFMDMTLQAPDMETLAKMTARQAGVAVDAETENSGLVLRARPTDAEGATPEDTRPNLRIQRPEAQDSTPTSISRSIFEDDMAAEPADETDVSAHLDPLTEPSDTDTFDDDFADTGFAPDNAAEVDRDMSEVSTADPAVLAPQDTQAAIDSAESVAEKLQRIRAIVGRSAPPKTEDTYTEDLTEQTDAAKPTPANPLAQRLAELAQRNTALVAKDATAEETKKDDSISRDVAARDDDEYDDENDAQPEEDLAEFATDDELFTDDPEELNTQPDDASDDSAEASDDPYDLRAQVAEVEQAIALRRESRSKRDELPRNVDAAMSRILSQADQHLNEPEGRRHRDTIAQLKAAVAATQAARQLGDSGNGGRDLGDVFREDLDAHEAAESADKNTEAPAATDEAPETSPAAPLRLVPAQRVDEAEKNTARPADRLRQIASLKTTTQQKPGSFAEFATQQGATELADLLEAAAAYIAFVEGDDDFSRPQVMRTVQMASPDEFSREDGLRSFGRLLRQSKIIKLDNGRFQVSQDTRFRPKDKAAQG